jgi:hypothetical protein
MTRENHGAEPPPLKGVRILGSEGLRDGWSPENLQQRIDEHYRAWRKGERGELSRDGEVIVALVERLRNEFGDTIWDRHLDPDAIRHAFHGPNCVDCRSGVTTTHFPRR